MSRNQSIFAILLIVFMASTSLAGAAGYDAGTFVVFLGEEEIGVEEFAFTEEGLSTTGVFSVGEQRLEISTLLTGTLGDWNGYKYESMGVKLEGTLAPNSFQIAVGPLEQSFSLSGSYALLDNNVFAQYQELIHLADANDGQVEFDMITPILFLMNQSPILQGRVSYDGIVEYEIDGVPVSLKEYSAVLDGTIYVQILSRMDGTMAALEIPAQLVKAVRKEFVGLTKIGAQENGSSSLQNDEEFQVPNGDVTLAGTLSLPSTSTGPYPVILLNSGSGPQDRNGNTPPVLMTYMFQTMAERFTQHGIAVLRYDERGVGASTGDYDEAAFSDLVSDVEALINFLKQHSQIDADRIFMLGHSEGAYIAPILADELAGMILLGGPSTPLDEIMVEQLEYQAASPWLSEAEREMVKSYVPLINQVLQDARAGKSESAVPMNLDWIREHMVLDPLENISQVKGPVLILHGTHDLKVMPYHAQALADRLRESGNDEVVVHYLDNTTHEFVFFPYDNPQYDPKQPLQVNPLVFDLTAEWLENQLK